MPHRLVGEDVILAGKALLFIPGILLSVIGVASEAPIYVGGGTIIVTLAGLFLRQFFQNQAATWVIARERKDDLEAERDRSHYLAWELDRLRYRYGERDQDPGPYIPRRHPVSLAKEDDA